MTASLAVAAMGVASAQPHDDPAPVADDVPSTAAASVAPRAADQAAAATPVAPATPETSTTTAAATLDRSDVVGLLREADEYLSAHPSSSTSALAQAAGETGALLATYDAQQSATGDTSADGATTSADPVADAVPTPAAVPSAAVPTTAATAPAASAAPEPTGAPAAGTASTPTAAPTAPADTAAPTTGTTTGTAAPTTSQGASPAAGATVSASPAISPAVADDARVSSDVCVAPTAGTPTSTPSDPTAPAVSSWSAASAFVGATTPVVGVAAPDSTAALVRAPGSLTAAWQAQPGTAAETDVALPDQALPDQALPDQATDSVDGTSTEGTSTAGTTAKDDPCVATEPAAEPTVPATTPSAPTTEPTEPTAPTTEPTGEPTGEPTTPATEPTAAAATTPAPTPTTAPTEAPAGTSTGSTGVTASADLPDGGVPAPAGLLAPVDPDAVTTVTSPDGRTDVTWDEVAASAVRLQKVLQSAEKADARANTSLADALQRVVDKFASSTSHYANGEIPASALCAVPFSPGQELRCDAEERLVALDAAFVKKFGHHIPITDSYRSFSEQVAVYAAKPRLAAIPGTSNHGWGLALDLGSPISSGLSAEYYWLRANAPDYGWDNPTWARLDGSKPEPWHFEFFAGGISPTSPGSGHSAEWYATLAAGRHDGDDEGGDAKPTATPKPTSTPKPTASPRPAVTSRPTSAPKPTSTPTPTPKPTSTPTPTPKPTSTPTPTPKPTSTPTPTPKPTSTPTPTPGATSSPADDPTPTPEPTATAARTPSGSPTGETSDTASAATPTASSESGKGDEG
ncbi:M15 family metallopeptidase [Luteimicrobium subarcticum]|nr:M15 family metallopeptidase [Luteimicrobium subarcticum]